ALLTRQSGDIEKAEKHCIKAVEQWRELAEEDPKVYEESLANALGTLAELYYNKEKIDEAYDILIEERQIERNLLNKDPDRYSASVAQRLHNLGYLAWKKGNLEDALRFTFEGLEIRKELIQKDFDTHALTLPDLIAAKTL